MAFKHSKDSYFAIENSSHSNTVLKQYMDKISGLPGARDLSEVTALGDQGTKSIPGLQNVKFSISGHFDPTATSGPHAVLNSLRTATGTVAFEYGPEGNSSGNVRLSGQCWLTSYQVQAGVGDKVSFSAEFQVDGTVSEGTF